MIVTAWKRLATALALAAVSGAREAPSESPRATYGTGSILRPLLSYAA